MRQLRVSEMRDRPSVSLSRQERWRRRLLREGMGSGILGEGLEFFRRWTACRHPWRSVLSIYMASCKPTRVYRPLLAVRGIHTESRGCLSVAYQMAELTSATASQGNRKPRRRNGQALAQSRDGALFRRIAHPRCEEPLSQSESPMPLRSEESLVDQGNK